MDGSLVMACVGSLIPLSFISRSSLPSHSTMAYLSHRAQLRLELLYALAAAGEFLQLALRLHRHTR